MINSVQIIAYGANQKLYFPSNAEHFFEFITTLSEFDILPIDTITDWVFPFMGDFVHEYLKKPLKRLLKKNGPSSSKSKDKGSDN